MNWGCTQESSSSFNNMQAGTFGQMFETGMETYCICGFRVRIGSGSGIIGSLSCSPGSPCRAILYAVNADDSVELLAYQEITEEISGVTDFFFDTVLVSYRESERYAVVIETGDNQWGLWQDCNASENCCPNARPVHIAGGIAIYNDPSYDDYYFDLRTHDAVDNCLYVVPAQTMTWGTIKSIYR